MDEPTASPSGECPPENREIQALRFALKEAAEALKRTEAQLAAAKAETEAEKVRATQRLANSLREKARAAQFHEDATRERERATKFEREWVRSQQVAGQLEAKLQAARQKAFSSSDEGLAAALKLETIDQENKRLRTAIAELYTERDNMRRLLTERSAAQPAKPEPKPESAALPSAEKVSIDYEITERVEPRSVSQRR